MFEPKFRTGPVLKFSLLALLTLAMVLLPSALRADTLTYDLSPGDTFQTNIGPLTGSFTVNFTTLTATATLLVDGETFTCNNCTMFSPGGVLTLEGFQAFGPGSSYIVLAWSKVPPEPNPLDFNTTYSGCLGCISSVDFLSAGDSATVPEPATALLLIPGLAVALPFARRKLAKA
ncbi:MAG: hypothetical protein WB780_04815 [Candidatus Acidiferrales bacterium]